MANPIKETPVLYGEDARRFAEHIENSIPETTKKIAEKKRDDEIFKQSLERRKNKKHTRSENTGQPKND